MVTLTSKQRVPWDLRKMRGSCALGLALTPDWFPPSLPPNTNGITLVSVLQSLPLEGSFLSKAYCTDPFRHSCGARLVCLVGEWNRQPDVYRLVHTGEVGL